MNMKLSPVSRGIQYFSEMPLPLNQRTNRVGNTCSFRFRRVRGTGAVEHGSQGRQPDIGPRDCDSAVTPFKKSDEKSREI